MTYWWLVIKDANVFLYLQTIFEVIHWLLANYYKYYKNVVSNKGYISIKLFTTNIYNNE